MELDFLAAEYVEVENDEPYDRNSDNGDLEDHACFLSPSVAKTPDVSRRENSVNMTHLGYVRGAGHAIRRSDEPNG